MPATRLHRLTIRFRGQEAQLVKVVAGRQGLSFAEWARAALLRHAQLELDPAPVNGRRAEPSRQA